MLELLELEMLMHRLLENLHTFSTGNVAVGAVGEFQMFGLCQQISGMTAGTSVSI